MAARRFTAAAAKGFTVSKGADVGAGADEREGALESHAPPIHAAQQWTSEKPRNCRRLLAFPLTRV